MTIKHNSIYKRYAPPKKRMITNARRDLNFNEALCELIDNSIDRKTTNRMTSPLSIIIDFDFIDRNGYYYDNAGGISKGNLHKIFIPGESINNNHLNEKLIGSFAMGAKKAIFHISDGTTVHSALPNKNSYYASIPKDWENNDEWIVEEGKSLFLHNSILTGNNKKLNGETIIQFEQLLIDENNGFNEIPYFLGEIYSELLKQNNKLSISINNKLIEPLDPIIWGNPKGGGAEPKRYKFQKKFDDIIGLDDQTVIMDFELICGLLTGINSSIDFGIDIYGNGRLFDKNLKTEIGLGYKQGLTIGGQPPKLFKGKLFINGPSEGIPWDMHKRRYMSEHPVAKYLKNCFANVFRAYLAIAREINVGDGIYNGINTFLANTDYNNEDIETVDLDSIDDLPEWPIQSLPRWKPPKEYVNLKKKERKDKSSNYMIRKMIKESDPALKTIMIELTDDELLQAFEMFEVSSVDDLENLVKSQLVKFINHEA